MLIIISNLLCFFILISGGYGSLILISSFRLFLYIYVYMDIDMRIGMDVDIWCFRMFGFF